MLRFQTPLIEPDLRVSRIRFSDGLFACSPTDCRAVASSGGPNPSTSCMYSSDFLHRPVLHLHRPVLHLHRPVLHLHRPVPARQPAPTPIRPVDGRRRMSASAPPRKRNSGQPSICCFSKHVESCEPQSGQSEWPPAVEALSGLQADLRRALSDQHNVERHDAHLDAGKMDADNLGTVL